MLRQRLASLLPRLAAVTATVTLLSCILKTSISGYVPFEFKSWHPILMTLGFCLAVPTGLVAYVANYGDKVSPAAVYVATARVGGGGRGDPSLCPPHAYRLEGEARASGPPVCFLYHFMLRSITPHHLVVKDNPRTCAATSLLTLAFTASLLLLLPFGRPTRSSPTALPVVCCTALFSC